jgi:thiamine-monophosphate kinase
MSGATSGAMSERELIAHLRLLFPRTGDDAAVLDDYPGKKVITSDMLIEDVDFKRAIPIELIARRSMAVNLSDLAAMGARPAYAVVSVGLPEWVPPIDFFNALAAAATEWKIEIVGGDLSRSDKLVISIAATGTTERPLLRSEAKPGDRIYVSRPIGASAAGLTLLRRQDWSLDPPLTLSYVQREMFSSMIRRHLDPEPELTLGAALSAMPEVTACIDISDGLSTDLGHLCDESHCGADIEQERLPIFPDLLNAGGSMQLRPRELVLHGGEEYALLFTSSLREAELSARVRRPVYAIGRMSRDMGVRLNGVALEPGGYDHFSG